MSPTRIQTLTLSAALLVNAACGTGVSGGPELVLNLVNPNATVSASHLIPLLLQGPQSVGLFSTTDIGQSVNSGATKDLESLKYYFKEIRICESLELNGSAYNNPKNCLTLYSAPTTDDYDSFGVTEAAANDSKYIDIMTSAGIAKLKENPAAAKAGTYSFGLIDWYKPIKVKGSVLLNDGTTRYRTPGTVTQKTDSSNNIFMEATSLTGATNQETVVMMNNGGNWFKFQNPLVLTGNDPITLDLVFNPDGLLTAGATMSNASIKTTGNNGIMVPLLDLSPVARADADKTVKESYTITPTGGKIKYRLELYYLKSDTSKSVFGADIKSKIIAGTTDDSFFHPSKIGFVTASGSTLTFGNYANTAMISNFARLTTVGGSGSGVTLDCTTLAQSGSSLCTSTATYTLDSIDNDASTTAID